MVKVPITRLGFERLYWQLQYLLRCSRREVAQDLAAARQHGLTVHNLEWRTAREKQRWLERRIEELQEQIEQCEVHLNRPVARGRVEFGLCVEILCRQVNRRHVVQLVGPFESDVSAGRLSVDSPVGRELLGRRVGEVVAVDCPEGRLDYQVLDVFCPEEGA